MSLKVDLFTMRLTVTVQSVPARGRGVGSEGKTWESILDQLDYSIGGR